ncbi:MFS transporter [Nonomuraea sp. B12E4]|uniref:MFS transporter n=1 Tax=Nonomuraea sp. B12E4 TaxID=3153564 RepID=UPI00325CFBE5
MALERALVRLLELTCGITIANVYYAQPLLPTIARELGIGPSAAGMLITVTQVGFACGLVFVVPLGDIIARRPLITTLLAIDAVALAVSAAASGPQVLGAAAILVGASSVVAQMVIPYAATLARPEHRGRTVATLMGALLLGVLLSRTFAGLVAEVSGWRWVYGVAAGVMAVMAATMYRMLPAGGREVDLGYAAQMRAVLRLARGEPVLRWRSLIGAAQFAMFSCFWSTVTFLLSGPPFGWSKAGIGLFALVGALGALCALGGGRLLDRRRTRLPVTGGAIVLLAGSFGVLAAGRSSLVWLVLGALLMDVCCQVVHVTNQAVIYDLVDAARSRLTTIYMTTYFFGGALGTAVGISAYDRYGWGGACAASAGFCGLAALGWLATYRHERPTAARLPAMSDQREN